MPGSPNKVVEINKAKILGGVKYWFKDTLGKEVKVPEDLANGVAVIEILNKLVPNLIKKYEAAPKNVLANTENWKKIQNALIRCAVISTDIPAPADAAAGKANDHIVNLLFKLKNRSKQLRIAPEGKVKALAKKVRKLNRRHKRLANKKANRLKMRTMGCIRAARYQRKYKLDREKRIRLHRKAEKKGHFYVPPEPKLAFVMRLRGINQVPPKPRKIMQLLRLRQIHNAVFVRLTKATLNMLKVIEPYVAIGYPSVRTVRALLIKRGYMKIRGQRIPITSNSVVRRALGRFKIQTLDDLIWNLVTTTRLFPVVNRNLWPFKMNSPRGGYNKGKLRHFVEGGAAGNRQGMINRLVRKCL